MPYRDLRDFLAQLEQRGELKRVACGSRSAARDDRALRSRAQGRRSRAAVRASEGSVSRTLGGHDPGARQPVRHAASASRSRWVPSDERLARRPARDRQAARVPQGARAAEEPARRVAEHAAGVHEGARHGAEGALDRRHARRWCGRAPTSISRACRCRPAGPATRRRSSRGASRSRAGRTRSGRTSASTASR